MLFKFSKIEQQHIAVMREELEGLRSHIDKAVEMFNEAQAEAFAPVMDAVEAYNEKVTELRELIEERVAEMDDAVSEKSDKWQQSEKGGSIMNWLEALHIDLDDIEPPVEPDAINPDDLGRHHVETLEDLPLEPDCE